MKVFVHLSQYDHVQVVGMTNRRMLWKVIYGSGDYQYSDWRANEQDDDDNDLPNYTLEEFMALTEEQLYKAIDDYTQSRGFPAIVEVEE
jgi:hypothetical protein